MQNGDNIVVVTQRVRMVVVVGKGYRRAALSGECSLNLWKGKVKKNKGGDADYQS